MTTIHLEHWNTIRKVCLLLSPHWDPGCVCSWRSERGHLTSASRYCGVQPRALGDVEFGQLLGAGGVNAHGVQQVSVGRATPGGKECERRYQRGREE